VVAVGVLTDALAFVIPFILLSRDDHLTQLRNWSSPSSPIASKPCITPVSPLLPPGSSSPICRYDNLYVSFSPALSLSSSVFVVTFPVAYLCDKYPWRRGPLLFAVIILEGALVMFMLCTPYWVMVVSRFLMGAASTIVWSGSSVP